MGIFYTYTVKIKLEERGVVMNKFLDSISDKLLPVANKLASNRYLSILRDAFMLAFPLTMFGSIVVVICNLPFLNDEMKAILNELLGSGQSATMSIMTVFVTFGIGYYLLFIKILWCGRYFWGCYFICKFPYIDTIFCHKR